MRDNSDKPANTVIGQSPEGGTAADEGSLVRITVSEGPPLATVPDVVGKGRLEARRTLTTAGLRGARDEVSPPRRSRSTASSLRIPDGDSVNQAGRAVTIEVSTGPERVTVPNVVGRTTEQARSALDAFKVAIEEKEDDEAEPGTVIAQDPARGELARGATVRLTVAVEPKQISVPDVVGRSQNSATKTLSGAGFEVAAEEVGRRHARRGRPRPGAVADAGRRQGRPRLDRDDHRRALRSALDPEPGTPTTTTTTPSTTTTTPAP